MVGFTFATTEKLNSPNGYKDIKGIILGELRT